MRKNSWAGYSMSPYGKALRHTNSSCAFMLDLCLSLLSIADCLVRTYAKEPLQSTVTEGFQNPVFVRFPVVTGSGPMVVNPNPLDHRDGLYHRNFDLTVDYDRGVVGREVDVADEHGRLLARGIIGWN